MAGGLTLDPGLALVLLPFAPLPATDRPGTSRERGPLPPAPAAASAAPRASPAWPRPRLRGLAARSTQRAGLAAGGCSREPEPSCSLERPPPPSRLLLQQKPGSSPIAGRMAVAPPSYCFVAFPPRTKDGLVVFGKNSARPREEVQEIVYFAAAAHDPGSKVECTYIAIDQVPKTHAVVLSKPAWLWGAEMGANEHGVCVANEAITTREPASETEALLGMDLVRLGLERGTTAKEALDVIISLLEEHGQGGNYYEDGSSCHAFQSAFLIVDRAEAWVLETVGKYWAAEKITDGVKCICNQLSLTTKIDAEHPELRNYAEIQGWWTGDTEFNFSEVFSLAEDHLGCCSGQESLEKKEGNITVQTMMDVLRDKASGVCVDSETFLTTASMVSVLPQNPSSPCIHYFTGTPDPSRSIFKPFIFVDDVKLVPKVQSPFLGDDDPVKKKPRFQEKPDRRHELYKAHEWSRSVTENDKERGQKLMRIMLELERQGLEAMEDILTSTEVLDPAEVVDLFYDCVDTEIKFFK